MRTGPSWIRVRREREGREEREGSCSSEARNAPWRPRVPVASKAIAALGVAYVLSPIELLPELLLGPIGLIDDLVVVGAALSRLLNHVHPDVVRSHWAGEGDALAAIQRATDWIDQAVTARVRGVVQRFLGPA